MKKILVLLCVLACSQIGFAKSKKSRYRTRAKIKRKMPNGRWVMTPVMGIVSTGYSFGNFNTNEVTNLRSESGAGVTAGIQVDLPFWSRYFTYSTGLNYSQNNTIFRFEARNNDFQGNVVSERQLERLNLPLTVSLFPFQKRNGFFIKTGVIGHYLLGGSEKGGSQGTLFNVNGQNQQTSFQESNEIERKLYNEYGVDGIVSTGVKFSGINGVGILIEVQYQHGFNDVNNYDSEESIQTRSFAGFLGFNFSL